MEVIAYHGWGFDASCWQPWQQWISQQGGQFRAFDRGYFGAAAQPVFSTTDRKLILAHSYGLHLCPIGQLEQADDLIIFSSFTRFHPESPRLQRRSQQIVQQMIDRFRVDPMLVLHNFRHRCAQPHIWTGPIPDSCNVDRLQQDLQQLNQAQLNQAQLNLILNTGMKQVMIIQGTEDRIVATAQGRQLAQHIPQSRYIEINAAGHALPFTHFADCQALLKSSFQAFSAISRSAYS